MADQPKVFLDPSALFAGLWSDIGWARQALKLAEAGLVVLVISPQILSEIENKQGDNNNPGRDIRQRKRKLLLTKQEIKKLIG